MSDRFVWWLLMHLLGYCFGKTNKIKKPIVFVAKLYVGGVNILNKC